MSRRIPALELLHFDFAFVALGVQHRGDLGRVAEERADFLLRAAQRVMFQRAGERKQKQQRRAFRPGADAGRAGGHGEHEEMHVNRALLQPFPDFFRRIKTAGQIGRDETRTDSEDGRTGRGKSRPARKRRTKSRRPAAFPFVNLPDVFEKFDVARDDLGKRHVAPAPECRRGRAGDARDGRASGRRFGS